MAMMVSSALTQDNREIAINTPLGKDVLLLQSVTGTEQLGRPFQYELQLLSAKHDIAFKDIVGQNVTIRLNLPGNKTRHFNGFVSRFVQSGFVLSEQKRLARYSATMVPWLWFLTRTADCRIFQDKTAPDIIKDVFRQAGFTDVDDRLGEKYRKWNYCVQYRETDFNFVSRLMEQEGIYYYFRHDDGKHVLVLADPKSSRESFSGFEEIPFGAIESGKEAKGTVQTWTIEQTIQPGLFAHTDFDFEKPASSLLAKSKIDRDYAHADSEVFDFPGEYVEVSDGENYARARIEEMQARQEVCFGTTDARGLALGRTFKIPNHARKDQSREYLVISAKHKLSTDSYESAQGSGGASTYTCDFTAMEASRPFRAARVTPKPVVQGPQTATVVGKKGEEIWTDEYGRVKVKFHWDRHGKSDETGSCWIRVAQVWAGKGWGAIFTPRIGQEVIVEFLEGDPDRPIVTGRVYNKRSMPPYPLPSNATISTVRSNSSKDGQGFNEIRLEDKKDEEQVFIHGQKNLDIRVENDRFETVIGSRHLHVEKDKFEHVDSNRSETVDADHKEEIGKDRHLSVKGKEAKAVDGSLSLTVKGDVNEAFKANHAEQTTQNYYLKAMGVVIEAMQGITLKCGSGSVVVDSVGVTIKGGVVTIDGGTTMINSGPGSPPASGSAGSAVSPAAPDKAEDADEADPGEVAEIKSEQMKKKEGKYGSTPITPFKPSDEKKSWIEIELVDEDDNPVPGARYRIETPDGSVTEGTLDEKGFAHVGGMDPGNCQITFPELDQEAWEKA